MTGLEAVILKSCDLPAMPPVAGRVIRLVSDPGASAEDLNRTIMMDQSLSAKVLKLANSSFYGYARTINTISQAIVVIGFKSLRNIVFAVSIKDVHKRFSLTEKMLYEHSIGAAIAAKVIAGATGLESGEDAFIAGLLHDIGKTVLHNNYPHKFSHIMEQVYNDGVPYGEAEQEAFGFSHADVGALLLKKWNFPEQMIRAVRFHHNTSALVSRRSAGQKLIAVTNLADALCQRQDAGEGEAAPLDSNAQKSLKFLDITEKQLEKIEAEILAGLQEMSPI